MMITLICLLGTFCEVTHGSDFDSDDKGDIGGAAGDGATNEVEDVADDGDGDSDGEDDAEGEDLEDDESEEDDSKYKE